MSSTGAKAPARRTPTRRERSATRTRRWLDGATPYVVPYTGMTMRKTSVYLDDKQAARLSRLARQEGRSQAEILREAITAYQPAPSRDRDFALAAGFPRIDNDPRPISQIPEHELLEGFGS